MLAPVPIVLVALGFIAGATAAPPPTAYLAELQAHRAELRALRAAIDRLPRAVPTNSEDAAARAAEVKRAGNDYLVEGRAFAKTLRGFIAGGTRRGLDSEVETIRATIGEVLQTVDAYRVLSGVKIERPPANTPSLLEQEFRRAIGEQIARRIPNKLVAEGVRRMIAGESFQNVLRETLEQAKQNAYAIVDSRVRAVTGLGLRDFRDLGRAIRLRANLEVDRQIMRLVVRATGNALVIELVREFVLPWLKAQLTELMRPHRTLEERVAISTTSLVRAKRGLDGLSPGARLSSVHARWQEAQAALAATKFLVADVKRAHREQLLGGDWGEAFTNVERTMDAAEARFLLHKEDLVQTLRADSQELHGLLNDLAQLVRHVLVPATKVGTCPDGLGLEWSEHEVGYTGTWKRTNCATSTWAASWRGGCDRSSITIVRSGNTVTARRTDACTFSPDFTATYTGTIAGRTIRGTEECRCRSAFPCSGSPRTWTQTWTADIVH